VECFRTRLEEAEANEADLSVHTWRLVKSLEECIRYVGLLATFDTDSCDEAARQGLQSLANSTNGRQDEDSDETSICGVELPIFAFCTCKRTCQFSLEVPSVISRTIDLEDQEADIPTEVKVALAGRYSAFLDAYNRGDITGLAILIHDEVAKPKERRSHDAPSSLLSVVSFLIGHLYGIPTDWKVPKVFCEEFAQKDMAQHWIYGIAP
jgi:hypothetical protein